MTRMMLMVTLTLAGIAAGQATGAVYYVSGDGADDNDGRSPETAWRSIARVNAHVLEPGDVVRLRRGDSWREQLLPRSGSEAGHVTYSAYGEGPKPLLLGSVAKGRPEDWEDEGNNIWRTTDPVVSGAETLPNPSFSPGSEYWRFHDENDAAAKAYRDTTEFASAPAGYRVDCERPGDRVTDIQFHTSPFSIERGQSYRVSFRAKSTQPFDLASPTLMATDDPWTRYSFERPRRARIGADWREFSQFYTAKQSADDARLTFYLGGRLPAGASVFIDDVSLREAEGDPLFVDVGNIILDNEATCGVKVWNEEDLDDQGKYWYDENERYLKMYSSECPATHYSSIECALRRHMISQSNTSYVVYEHLALKYGGAHGIGGGSTHHIIVRDCDFGFIGGGDQYGGERTVRFGNGVEFWGIAHDNLVERCRLWEVYDAALTNQAGGPDTPQIDITYRNNLIWNCEYSFEYWNRPEQSRTENIYFDNNTCLNAGHGWGHTQRPNPSGRHLCFYTSPARARNICIRNNIFYEAKAHAFYAPPWPDEAIAALVMDHNCWYQAEGVMIHLKDSPFTMAQFADYQAHRNKEPNSIVGVPGLVDAENGDLRLRPDSPCIDAGADVGVEGDFVGAPRPQGIAPDIGAYELPGE